jgi:hypothetical protein
MINDARRYKTEQSIFFLFMFTSTDRSLKNKVNSKKAELLGIFEQSMGARNREEIGLSYLKLIPRFLKV